MDPKKCIEIFKRFEKENANPKCELHYTSPYELLVAVILSAHSTDKSVNKATSLLFTVANTPEKMVKLGKEKLIQHVKTIGLYNTKAKNIINMSQLLVDQHRSNVPNKREALENLPGVGRKSANVILNTVFNEPTIAVDTHVFRVSNRTNLAPGKTVLAVEKELNQVVPEKFKPKAHHWLVLHGRYICTAKKPHCAACLIEDLCEYKNKIITTY